MGYRMPWTKDHLALLTKTPKRITLACGKKVPVWKLKASSDDALLRKWAKHFRNHYCRDTEIDILRNGTPHTRAEYLRSIKFPDQRLPPGPSIRSGDFAEILVADYVQYILGFWVPRTRYHDKTVRNESTKGTDILGFKLLEEDGESPEDTLALFEAKAQLSALPSHSRLQEAISDSVKDQLRKAESLNAVKQRLLFGGELSKIPMVERFQNLEDRPYKEQFGAVALFSSVALSIDLERTADTSSHPSHPDLHVLIISGEDLMTLVHLLYERAANEA